MFIIWLLWHVSKKLNELTTRLGTTQNTPQGNLTNLSAKVRVSCLLGRFVHLIEPKKYLSSFSERCNTLYFTWTWQSLKPAGLAHKVASISSSCCWQHVTTWYSQSSSTASPIIANFVQDYNIFLCSLATIILITVSSRKKMKWKNTENVQVRFARPWSERQ